jgi:hypothetical protein
MFYDGEQSEDATLSTIEARESIEDEIKDRERDEQEDRELDYAD